MKVELHMIQNFAPHCLNRDDTGSPKDCQFGGVRRARISSQCIKRAIRKCFEQEELLPPENLAQRTKRIAETVADRLANKGRDAQQAQEVVKTALGASKFGVDDEGQTEYLLFVSRQGLDRLAALCDEHWDTLVKISPAKQDEEDEGARSRKSRKKKAADAVPKEVREALGDFLTVGKAADLAMFGRMLADIPERNVDAACQVAHAISTNRVAMEMDFYTAVDDLKTTEEDAGAGMMGVVGYNSSCFYRYAVVDLDQLQANMEGDAELARKAVEAFLRASVQAIPTGKQNTFAAHNPPDFVLAFARTAGQPLSLANAFVEPARPRPGADLVADSVNRLAGYWSEINGVFGRDGELAAATWCGTRPPEMNATGWQKSETFDALVMRIMEAIQ